jgi:hypothetical protein
MAIQRRFCKNHPDRPAIGVCIITHEAICSECSTRYEGVNYSKEGLRILQERRRGADRPRPASAQNIILLLFSPLMLLLLYWSYYSLVATLISLTH